MFFSDSKYVITGITQWVLVGRKMIGKPENKTNVLNKDLWQRLIEVTKDKEIEYKHVEGHVGIAGNERVDVIANSFARGKEVSLFKGDLENYSVNLLDMKKMNLLQSKKQNLNLQPKRILI
ncbi:MAG: RNase H family protein [Candidatus Paceibacterota bacterium]